MLQSIALLANGATLLAKKAVAGLEIDRERVALSLDRNPILVTALNAVIGYEKGAEIAKSAYAQHRRVIDVAWEMTDLDEGTLLRLFDPLALTGGRGERLP